MPTGSVDPTEASITEWIKAGKDRRDLILGHKIMLACFVGPLAMIYTHGIVQ